jgi:8-oxo-dGTP diphosphatase
VARVPASPDAGAWALPGGTLEADETLEDVDPAASRGEGRRQEVAPPGATRLVERARPKSGAPELATAFLGIVPAGVDPQLPTTPAWQPVDSLPALAFDTARSSTPARAVARKALLHEHRLRAAPPVVHPFGVARPLRGALGHDVSATNLKRVLLRRNVLETRGLGASRDAPAGAGRGLPVPHAALEITDPFATLRPPG